MTHSVSHWCTRIVALSVTTSLILLSPGLGAYQALAGNVVAPAVSQQAPGGMTVSPVVLPGFSALGSGALSGSLSGNVSLTPSLPGSLALPPVKVQDHAAPGAAPAAIAVSQVAPAATVVSKAAPLSSAVSPLNHSVSAVKGSVSQAAPVAAVSAKAAPVSQPAAAAQQQRASAVSSKIGELSKGVGAALQSAGPVAQARPEAAYALGGELHDLLGGAARTSVDSTVVAPRGGRMASLGRFENSRGGYHGDPAGKGSIEAAVRAYNAAMEAGVTEETPPAQTPAAPQAPLAARAFAALVAAAPAVLVGIPLIMSGSVLAGAFVTLASLSLMAMPFFGQKTPRFVRTLPGVAVAGLGLFTLVSGVVSGTGIAMGVLVTLGGWGLYRFGKQADDKYFDEGKMITAFFGAIGAVAGAGLAAVAPAALVAAWLGWLPGISSIAGGLSYGVVAAKWLSYPLAAMLLMHLPGWLGEGIGSAVDGLMYSVRGVSRTLVSVDTDTVLYKRLSRYSEAKLNLSVWNVFKVGALWIPLWLADAAGWVLSAAAGLAMGVVQAPTMLVWGAAHNLAKESSFTKFMAAWNRFVFLNAQASKNTVYNKLARPFARGANSESALVSVPSYAGLRLAQVAWLAYAVLATPFLYIAGFVKAFSATGEAYDVKKHSPWYLATVSYEKPVELPQLGQGGAVKDLIPPGLFATALALAPAYFFGLPIVSVTVLGPVYLAVALAVAAMPLLPVKTPVAVRKAPGIALAGLGLLTMALVPYLSFTIASGSILAFLHSGGFWMGLVTFLGGLGLYNVVDKLAKEEAVPGQPGQPARKYWVNEPEYIGAFFGALGLLTGTGIVLAGATGLVPNILTTVAYLASPLLLAHLPKWFWTGIWNMFRGAGASAEAFYAVNSTPWKDTKFYRNLSDWTKYYMKGSVWQVAANATWLSLVWVPLGILAAAGSLLSLALGLAAGVLRAPFNWLWGAAYDAAPEGRFSRFMAGFMQSWLNSSEGSKKAYSGQAQPLFTYDGMAGRLFPAMDEKSAATSRPTLKAVGAALAARLLQAVWLAAVVLAQPGILLKAVVDGIRHASGVKPPPGEHGWDFDNPRHFYRYRDVRR